jgi:hypothetical protein
MLNAGEKLGRLSTFRDKLESIVCMDWGEICTIWCNNPSREFDWLTPWDVLEADDWHIKFEKMIEDRIKHQIGWLSN